MRGGTNVNAATSAIELLEIKDDLRLIPVNRTPEHYESGKFGAQKWEILKIEKFWFLKF